MTKYMNSYTYIHQYIYLYAPIENAYTPLHNHTSKLPLGEKMKVQKNTPADRTLTWEEKSGGVPEHCTKV